MFRHLAFLQKYVLDIIPIVNFPSNVNGLKVVTASQSQDIESSPQIQWLSWSEILDKPNPGGGVYLNKLWCQFKPASVTSAGDLLWY